MATKERAFSLDLNPTLGRLGMADGRVEDNGKRAPGWTRFQQPPFFHEKFPRLSEWNVALRWRRKMGVMSD